jgi:hypothetical protein
MADRKYLTAITDAVRSSNMEESLQRISRINQLIEFRDLAVLPEPTGEIRDWASTLSNDFPKAVDAYRLALNVIVARLSQIDYSTVAP